MHFTLIVYKTKILSTIFIFPFHSSLLFPFHSVAQVAPIHPMKFLYILSASVLMHQAAVRAYSATAGSCPNTYEAQSGDTCSSIASKFNINENDIQTWNPNFSCSSIATSDILCISAPYNSATAPATGSSSINTSPTTSATSSSSSAAIPTTHPHGRTVSVKSEKDFCIFLPTKPGQEIQASGKKTIASMKKMF